ncbi:MAG TPA: sulfotransferase [Gemmataceae bacterium]|nr:sulfotransferase [Gemmataceae bacterium]
MLKTTSDSERDATFYVPPPLDFLGALVDRFPALWLRLGRLESSILSAELREIALTSPIYVCGLARSGSTMLHEMVAAHPGVATHRIKDYPLIFTPYWWRQATAGLPATPPRQRPHRDRIVITSESPDSLDEMLWMAFFPRSHDPSLSNVLRAEMRHSEFESFYRSHIRKLLLAERASRYVAKANYHVARLSYLVRLFPDVKLLIPVRSPMGHIASLMRQHEWFSQGQRKHRRALAYMRRSGHFEFGLDRRPMNLGDSQRVQSILRAWASGQDIRGWARYWAMVYDHIASVLNTDDRVRQAALVVRFERLCDAPAETLRTILEHCGLPEVERLIARFAPVIATPDYYAHSFSPAELAIIQEETASTARQWEC